MRDNFLVFGSPVIGEAEIVEVVDSLRSGWIGTGAKVQRFERMLAEYVGVRECRCVSSCTAALILSIDQAGGVAHPWRSACELAAFPVRSSNVS